MLRRIGGLCCAVFLTCAACIMPTWADAGPQIGGENPFTEGSTSELGEAENIAVLGAKEGEFKEDALINVIKGGVNWVLGILAFIALIVLLRGGFLMVTASGNEDRYNKGWTILKQAAIGLIVIGIARFIISIIFWLVNQTGSGVGAADSQN